MKILALDSSSIAASVAILEEERLLTEIVINHQRTHSEKLVPMIKAALEHCSLTPSDIDIFTSTLGPGSFTGLRIGLTTIKAMAQALDKPVVGISTLQALAYQFPFCSSMICPIIDAQRESVYTALYRRQEEGLVQLMEPRVIEIKELVEILKSYQEGVLFTGDAQAKFKGTLADSLGQAATFAPEPMSMIRAAMVGELARIRAKEGKLQTASELLPIYMRKSQAEKQYEEKMKGQVSG
ncbi:tRNA (adenosine(37)-N6)-threonylcarbamoyltransferase complex dimerization subunit type 1 TsaB [Alkaliphilus crotonatoxidans]